MTNGLVDLEHVNTLGEGGAIKLNLGQSRKRAIYWRPLANGGWAQTAPLPADPFSISYYFAKGFRGKPPVYEKSLGEGQFSGKTEIKLK